MAKVAFSKLGLKVNTNVGKFTIGDQTIEVKAYLPIQDKLEMISRIINQSTDDNGYYNQGKVEIFMLLEMVFAYTNITFTEKQKEDVTGLYDKLVSSDFMEDFMTVMSSSEVAFIRNITYTIIDKIYEYKNSAYGILDAISTDYSNLNLDALQIKENLADPNNMALLKDVLTKLG